MVKDLLGRFRALPAEQQRSAPALLNGIGKLEVAVGDFDTARKVFQALATVAPDAAARAEAHHNAFRTALEQGQNEQALAELKKALDLDPERFAPFPLDKYEPLRVLGA